MGVSLNSGAKVPLIWSAPGAGWNAIASGDFDGDGKSDIIWQNPTTGDAEIYLERDSSALNRLGIPKGLRV